MNTYDNGNRRIWYDRSIRFWTLQIRDANGDQIGEVEYEPTKTLAFGWLKTGKIEKQERVAG